MNKHFFICLNIEIFTSGTADELCKIGVNCGDEGVALDGGLNNPLDGGLNTHFVGGLITPGVCINNGCVG